MSDNSVSETGKRVSEGAMSDAALSDAKGWADALMEREWQGRRDKEKAVRYRLAKKIGVAESYLFRLQYKHHEMNDVKGSVYRALLLAYSAVRDAGEQAYEQEKRLADARGSKVAGLAAVVAGPKIGREMN